MTYMSTPKRSVHQLLCCKKMWSTVISHKASIKKSKMVKIFVLIIQTTSFQLRIACQNYFFFFLKLLDLHTLTTLLYNLMQSILLWCLVGYWTKLHSEIFVIICKQEVQKIRSSTVQCTTITMILVICPYLSEHYKCTLHIYFRIDLHCTVHVYLLPVSVYGIVNLWLTGILIF